MAIPIKKERMHWIDYAKLIGVWCVAIDHVKMDNYTFIAWILSFHMPIFFILSGFVDKGKASVIDTIKKSAKTLLVPYFWFYLITYVFWLLVTFRRHPEMYTHDISGGFFKPMLGMLLGEGMQTSISTMINVPLWFLVALFFCKVIFTFFLSFDRKKYTGLIILNVLSVALIYIRAESGVNIFFSIDSAIMSIPFYTFGFFIKGKLDKVDKNIIIRVLLFASLFVAGILLSRWNGWVDMNTSTFGRNIFVYYINGLAGAMAIIFFTRLFSKIRNPLFAYLGENTLIIFAFHLIITGFVKRTYEFITGAHFDYGYTFSPIESAIMCAFMLIISAIPVYLIKNYFPFIIGQKKVIAPK